MKASPTLEGGLRIDLENAQDHHILKSILTDAASSPDDLADRLGKLIDADTGGEDWQEYVTPDLRESFHDDLSHVSAALDEAFFNAENGSTSFWIKPEDGFQWYSALNQARLAIEEIHHFGGTGPPPPPDSDPSLLAAWIRSYFYQSLQGLLLEHVMKEAP